MPKPSPIILASASPRRAELLRTARIPFEVIVSPTEEPEHKSAGIPIDLWPICLAYMKATAVQHQIENRKSRSGKIENPPTILAADTIVIDGHRILNKPRDRAHARRMLLSLQHKTHRVITGIALLRGEKLRLSSASATCRIRFTKKSLASYLDSNLWQGKAGAYGIQDNHDPFVRLLSGDITTVIGLPMPLVLAELAAFEKD